LVSVGEEKTFVKWNIAGKLFKCMESAQVR